MKIKYLILLICVGFTACKIPALISKQENKTVPAFYNTVQDSTNIASVKWRQYFTDPYLIAIIDSALKNNQELNIALREIEIDKNEIQARKGEYLPFVNLVGVAGVIYLFTGEWEYASLGALLYIGWEALGYFLHERVWAKFGKGIK